MPWEQEYAGSNPAAPTIWRHVMSCIERQHDNRYTHHWLEVVKDKIVRCDRCGKVGVLIHKTGYRRRDYAVFSPSEIDIVFD